MKNKKFIALVLSAGVVFSIASCGNQETEEPPVTETWSDKQIADAAMASSAILVDNKTTPIRDSANYGDTYVNKLTSLTGGYLVAANHFNVISEVGLTYTVDFTWDFDETYFSSTEDGSDLRIAPLWDTFEKDAEIKTTITGTASYNGTKSSSLTYNITLVNDGVITLIENIPDNGTVMVRGYVTGKIPSTVATEEGKKDSGYVMYVQSGDYGFAVYQPNQDVYNSFEIGDAVQVNGPSSPYNGQRQITGGSASITKVTDSQILATMPKPNTLTVDDANLINPNTFASMTTLEGVKITEVVDCPNVYKDTTTPHAYIHAKGLYKGKEVVLYTDRYNGDNKSKEAFLSKLNEALESNGTKTITMTGAQAIGKLFSYNEETKETKDEKVYTPSLYLTDVEEVKVVDKAYEEVTPVINFDVEKMYGNSKWKIDIGETTDILASLSTDKEAPITYTSSNTGVATVNDKGVVTGVESGMTTITASAEVDGKTITGKVNIQVKVPAENVGEQDYTKLTVAEALTTKDDLKTRAYVIRGKISKLGQYDDQTDAGQYGNLYLQDLEDESKRILVYGMTADYKALTYNEKGGVYDFENPKDYSTNPDTKDLKVGDIVTVVAIIDEFKGTKQLNAVLSGGANDSRVTAHEATLEEINNYEPVSSDGMTGQFVYKVTAKIKSFKNGETKDEYGNMVVTDLEGKNETTVYGSTVKTDAISFNYKDSWKYSIGNPKNFLEEEVTKNLKIGDVITFECVRSDFKGEVQISADNLKLAE